MVVDDRLAKNFCTFVILMFEMFCFIAKTAMLVMLPHVTWSVKRKEMSQLLNQRQVQRGTLKNEDEDTETNKEFHGNTYSIEFIFRSPKVCLG